MGFVPEAVAAWRGRLVSRIMSGVCVVLALAFSVWPIFGAGLDVARALWPEAHILGAVQTVCHGFSPGQVPVPSVLPPLEQWPVAPCPYDPAPAIIGAFVSLIPLLLLAVGFFQMVFCFAELAKGAIFSRRVADRVRAFALCGVGYFLLTPFVNDITNLLIPLFEPKLSLHRFVSEGATLKAGVGGDIFELYPPNLLALIYAITLAILATILARSAALAEDHAQIV